MSRAAVPPAGGPVLDSHAPDSPGGENVGSGGVGSGSAGSGGAGSGRRPLPRRPAHRRPWPFLAIAFALALVLAVGSQLLAALRMEQTEPALGACWIWARGVAEMGEPTAFWAVRDFVLASEGPAWIVLAADEEYVLWVNGVRVGSGVYRPRAPAHLYELTDYLDVGWNRLAIEARSHRGAGGILASLRIGQVDQPSLVTDDTWRIVRQDDPRVLGGLALPEEQTEPPQVWGLGRAGRWRPEPADGVRPTLDTGWPRPERHPPRHLRYADDGSPWQPVRLAARRLPGEKAIYDFGREVEGYLELRVVVDRGTDPASVPPALLFFDEHDPEHFDRRPDAVLRLLDAEGLWRDTLPRRFRYLAVIGAPDLLDLSVEPVDAEAAERLRPATAPAGGVFGLPPAKDYTPVEEAVWDRLDPDRSSSERPSSHRAGPGADGDAESGRPIR